MKPVRTLQPADQVGHYRVVGPLGAGGMGEVYLAQDQRLERNVALKILPPELVRSEERVRRFVQEAKSASSLNHPNVITIYEIGQEQVRPAGAESDSGAVQFISMELVSGKTLGKKIHEEKTDLRTLLGYLAQAAEGVSKAHAAGIVHRDLKPGNIMVSDEGFAKVLDFGLAKLTEKRAPDAGATSAPTESARDTAEGLVVGTVGYMSPEQVQGKSVDHRSDVFSFGCILYEASTRQRPFEADSNVETMHRILHDKPAPIEQANPAAPAELRRLIRRCLAKSPDQRLQSMKDLAIELREIVEEYDTLSTSTSSGSGSTAAAAAEAARPRVPIAAIAGGAIFVAVAGVGFGLWGMRRAAEHRPAGALQAVRIVTQTNRGDVGECAISADGRYLAYTTAKAGRMSLRVRQVATGSDVEVLPPENVVLESPAFSPDGNYVFYRQRRPDIPGFSTLYQVPSLGGAPQERIFDVDSRPTFSPDGKRVSFVRGDFAKSTQALILHELETGKERELATVKQPQWLGGKSSWSPDGKRVAAVIGSPPTRSTVVLYDLENGRREDLYSWDEGALWDPVWLGDGSGLAMVGSSLDNEVAGLGSQIYLLTYPAGRLRQVTNDVSGYRELSASSGDEAIAATRSSSLSNLWVIDPAGGGPRQITSVTNAENSPWSYAVTPQGRVLFNAVRDQGVGVFSVSLEGGEPRPVPLGAGPVFTLQSEAATLLFLRPDAERIIHLWKAGLDGSGARQLTHEKGEWVLGLSRDGRFATFARADSARGVWMISVESGRTSLVSSTATRGFGQFSPDGGRILLTQYRSEQGPVGRSVYEVVRVPGGEVVATLPLPPRAALVRWGPDGESLCFRADADSNRNVYRQPLAGGPPVPVTRYTTGQVTTYKWSPDGTRLALAREIGGSTNLWVAKPDGSEPVQITQFGSERVWSFNWTPDGTRLVMRVGRSSSDAVLVRNFR